jgi:uncharacterized protein (DUF302 family)
LKGEVLEVSYYISRLIAGPFDAAVDKVKAELKKEGFGVLTEIDVRRTLKEKLNVEFRNYRILGSCNPPFAYKALLAEAKIGLMLPCNVIVQETADGRVEVAAIDPVASMQAVQNPALEPIGLEVRAKLKRIIDSL